MVVGTGSNLTGQSGDQADGTTLQLTTTQQLQVQSLRPLTNNNYGQYARAIVTIFLHYKKAVAGQGTVY